MPINFLSDLTSPSFVTPILGTPSSGTLTSCIGLPIVNGTTGTLSVARGGTGVVTSTGTGSNVLSVSPTFTGSVTIGSLLTFANPGIGQSTKFVFSKTNDSAWLDVKERSSDKTYYEFGMADNPTSSDYFQWKMNSWEGAGIGWMPLQIGAFTNRFVASSNKIWGNVSMPVNTSFATVNNSTTSDVNYEVLKYTPTNSTTQTLYKDSGTGTGTVILNAASFTGTSKVQYWIKIDTGGTSFSWGTTSNVSIATGVTITGTAQTLNYGVTVTLSTTNHVANDKWTWVSFPRPTSAIGGNPTTTAMQTIFPAAGIMGQVIKGASGQTANLQEWQDSSATVLASISSTGSVKLNNLTASQTLETDASKNVISVAKQTGYNLALSTTATDIKINGTQSLGSLSTLARADHVHPVYAKKTSISRAINAAEGWVKIWRNTSYGGIRTTDFKITSGYNNCNNLIEFRTVTAWYGFNHSIVTKSIGNYNSGNVLQIRTNYVSSMNVEVWVKLDAVNATQPGTIIFEASDALLVDTPIVEVEPTWDSRSVYIDPKFQIGSVPVHITCPIIAPKIMAGNSAGLALYEDGGQGIFIKDGGNVGIGTTTPTKKLDVAGVTRITEGTANKYALLYENKLRFTRGSDGAETGQIDYDGVAKLTLNSAGGSSTGATRLDFQVNSGSKMVIDNEGDVGIGTATPGHKLHVVGDKVAHQNDTGGFYRYNAAGTFRAAFTDNNTTTQIYADGDGSNAAMTFNAGNVGIGTTAPGGLLALSGSVSDTALLGATAGATSNALFNLAPSSDNIVRYGLRLSATGNDLNLDYRKSTDGSPNTAMTIQRSSGNVGIGTASPAQKLDVVGNIAASGNLTAAAGTFSSDINSSGTININKSSADTYSTGFNVRKRGTTGDATAAVTSGTELGYHGFYGWDGTASSRGAYAISNATQNWTSSARGTSYGIAVTANGTTANSLAFNINQDKTATFYGSVKLNNLTASQTLELDASKNIISAAKQTGYNLALSTTATDIKVNGTQSLGSLSTLARADHVHPTDTSRAPTVSPTFTGTVVLPSGQALIAPALGTPSSGTLTNCTFPTLNQSTTGNADTATKIASITNSDIVQLTTAQTLTFKTLFRPTIQGYATFIGSTSGTTRLAATAVAGTTVLTLPAATDTLVGRNTADTLTNKTLTAPRISSIVNTGTLTLPTSTDTLVGRNTADTLTNKTLTAPTITGAGAIAGVFTGNITGDVTGNADTVTTNADLTGPVTSSGNITAIANGAITTAMQKHLQTFEFNGYIASAASTNYFIPTTIAVGTGPFSHSVDAGSDGLTALTPAALSRSGGKVMPYAGTCKLWKGWVGVTGTAAFKVSIFKYTPTAGNTTNASLVLVKEFSGTAGNAGSYLIAIDLTTGFASFSAGDILITGISCASGATAYFTSTLEVEWN